MINEILEEGFKNLGGKINQFTNNMVGINFALIIWPGEDPPLVRHSFGDQKTFEAAIRKLLPEPKAVEYPRREYRPMSD